ncbi:MAG: PilL protein, partial [Pseudomonadota bacterium]
HVSHRQVRERKPDQHEQQHRRELDALGEGADDQRRRDGGEGELEDEVHVLRDVHALAERGRERVGGEALVAREAALEVGGEKAFGDLVVDASASLADTQQTYPRRDELLEQWRIQSWYAHMLGDEKAAVVNYFYRNPNDMFSPETAPFCVPRALMLMLQSLCGDQKRAKSP